MGTTRKVGKERHEKSLSLSLQMQSHFFRNCESKQEKQPKIKLLHTTLRTSSTHNALHEERSSIFAQWSIRLWLWLVDCVVCCSMYRNHETIQAPKWMNEPTNKEKCANHLRYVRRQRRKELTRVQKQKQILFCFLLFSVNRRDAINVLCRRMILFRLLRSFLIKFYIFFVPYETTKVFLNERQRSMICRLASDERKSQKSVNQAANNERNATRRKLLTF